MSSEASDVKKRKLEDDGQTIDKKPKGATQVSFAEEEVLKQDIMQAVATNNIDYIKGRFGDLNVRVVRKDGQYSSLLATALDHHKVPMALFLIAHGADVNTEVCIASQVQGWNTRFSYNGPLIGHLSYWSSFAEQDALQVLDALVNAGVKLNVKFKHHTLWDSGTTLESEGQTFLYALVSRSDRLCNKKRIIEAVLKAGADPNLPNEPDNGFVETPLVRAIKDSRPDLVELLLTYGADINHPWRISPLQDFVNTPMDLAESYLRKETTPAIQDRHKKIWALMQEASLMRQNKWAILMGMHTRVGAESKIKHLHGMNAVPIFNEIFNFLGPPRGDRKNNTSTTTSTSTTCVDTGLEAENLVADSTKNFSSS